MNILRSKLEPEIAKAVAERPLRLRVELDRSAQSPPSESFYLSPGAGEGNLFPGGFSFKSPNSVRYSCQHLGQKSQGEQGETAKS